ncbi:Transmembrane protein, partial [Globisporangium polare]
PIVVEMAESFDDFATPQSLNRCDRSATVTTDTSSEELFVLRNTTRVRFVAGERFYNVEMFGSLRKGGAVHFFSMGNVGLWVAVVISAFSHMGLEGVVLPLLKTQLAMSKHEELAMQRVVDLPVVLSFLFGLLSDFYPVRGLRRKSYMVLGSLLFGASAVVLSGITPPFGSGGTTTTTRESSTDAHVVLVILLSVLARAGCAISHLCVETQVIELSQREPLRTRGAFQASYLILRRITSLLSSLFTFAVLRSASGEPRGLRPWLPIFVLACVAVLPLPVVWKLWREEQHSCSAISPPPPSFPACVSAYWRTVQQKAVWRILVFIAAFSFFLSVSFVESAQVVTQWAGASGDHYLVIRTIQDLVVLLSIVVWRAWCLNLDWRVLFSLGPVFAILPSLFASVFVALDVVRDRYFYRAFTSLAFVRDAVSALAALVPVTEIVQEGTEASTVGLVLSIQRLIGTLASTVSGELFQGETFYDPSQVASDSRSIRSKVLLSLVLNYAINALALASLSLLPKQKIDTQQLRIYGGFTKVAAQGVAGLVFVLVVYTVIIDAASFSPRLACHRIVGGGGCT